MIILRPLLDQWEIKKALTKDNLYLSCFNTDDLYSEAVLREDIAWYEVLKDTKVIGVLFLKQISGLCVSPHGGIYKDFRNKDSLNILKEIITILKTKNLKLIYMVPTTNTTMIKLLSKLGYMKQLIIKDGTVNSDLTILGEV